MLKKSNSSKINWLKSRVNQSIPGKSANSQNIANSRYQSASRIGQSNYVFNDDSIEKQLKSFLSDIKVIVFDRSCDTDRVSDLGSDVLHANISDVCDNLRSIVALLLSQNESFELEYSLLNITCSENFIKVMLAWTKFCLQHDDFVDRLIEEQLVLYEVFITQSGQKFLTEKEFLQPLLELLDLCSMKLQSDWRDNFSLEEKFISILHQICVGITTQSEVLELIFNGSSSEDKFSVFNLLVPFVHREGVTGQQARDALLLIMSLSAKHEKIGFFIANESNFCPVLATGLSGLYSSLPCNLEYPSDDWHHLSDEDVSHIPDLKMFLNSLEFCNAVIQASHPAICTRLLEFIMDGFLLPVIGPALNQLDSDMISVITDFDDTSVTTIEEAVAATAYFDLFIRKITEPNLLKVFVDFIIFGKVDEVLVLDILIARISSQLTRLCVVTLRLFYSLIDLNCEDVMFHLVFKHIMPGKHIMLSQHHSMREVDYYAADASKFLSMIPECCHLFHADDISIDGLETSFSSVGEDKPLSKPSKGNSLLNHISPLLSTFEDPSYVEYLARAHYMISSCREACKNWLFKYETIQPVIKKEMEETSDISEALTSHRQESMEEKKMAQDDLIYPADNDSQEKQDDFRFLESDECSESFTGDSNLPDLLKEIDHLYGQFCHKKENKLAMFTVQDQKSKEVENNDLLNEFLTLEKPSIGSFLEALFSRVERMVQSTLYVNLQLTSLITRLSCYPHPLLRTLILSHNLVFQPSVKSFLQILNTVKKKLEDYLDNIPQKEACLNQAHQFLIYRVSPDVSLVPFEVFKSGSRRRSSGFHELFKTNNKQNRLVFSNLTAQYVHRPMMGEEEEKESIERKNAVYAALVYKEFLKELAAISLEHAVICLS